MEELPHPDLELFPDVQDEFFPNLNLPGEVFPIEQDELTEDDDRVKSRTIRVPSKAFYSTLKEICQYMKTWS